MTERTKRIVVTGTHGQVATSLCERSSRRPELQVVLLGRPQLDLERPDDIASSLVDARPDLIVSAAAYTAVDQAEKDEATAQIVNAAAAGRIAEVADRLCIPIIHLSTDYVFDGFSTIPYVEADPVAPLSAYGRTKLAGERAVANATVNHAILRTAWVYGPYGRNFLRTMLRLAEERQRIGVVADQVGCPTSSLDLADGILAVATNLLAGSAPQYRGVFHMVGGGETSWAHFAQEIFTKSASVGGASAVVDAILTENYPTPAARPANSRLDCSKLQAAHGITLRHWRQALNDVIEKIYPCSGGKSDSLEVTS